MLIKHACLKGLLSHVSCICHCCQVTNIKDRFLNVFVFVIVVLLDRSCFHITLVKCLNQWSKSLKIALWACSLQVFVIVIVIVFVFVFVFVVVFLLVRSCFRMTPINFARFQFGLEGRKALNPTQWVSQSITKVGLELLGQLKKHKNKLFHYVH